MIRDLCGPYGMDTSLNELQVVAVDRVVGSSSELKLINFFLANFAWLRLLLLRRNTNIVTDPVQELRITKELMRYPRASSTAEIVWI